MWSFGTRARPRATQTRGAVLLPERELVGLTLHVTAATIWVGQTVWAALVPVLEIARRSLSKHERPTTSAADPCLCTVYKRCQRTRGLFGWATPVCGHSGGRPGQACRFLVLPCRMQSGSRSLSRTSRAVGSLLLLLDPPGSWSTAVRGVRSRLACGGAGEWFEGRGEVEAVHMCRSGPVGVDPLELQTGGVRAVSVE